MTTQEAHKKFEGQITALWLVAHYLNRAVSLLRKSNEGKVHLKTKKEIDLMRIVLTHYIVNNSASLFDDKDKRNNSLRNIAKRFERHFPINFFSEYLEYVDKFRIKHKKDLARIEKNRNLSTAHLGAGEKERLGWDSTTAQKLDKILGTKSSVAQEDSLRFITPFQLFEMKIVEEIPELLSALDSLQMKFAGLNNYPGNE